MNNLTNVMGKEIPRSFKKLRSGEQIQIPTFTNVAAAIAAGPGPSEVRAAQVRSEGWEARVAEMQEIVAAALAGRKKQAA